MHALQREDVDLLVKSSSDFKVIVPLATLGAECNDGILKELLENMLDLALQYTESVCRWQRMVVEGKLNFDEHGMREAIEAWCLAL